MKKLISSILSFVVAIASLTIVPVTSANAAETTDGEYEINYDTSDRVIVSLGDSYSAGEGLGDYYDGDLDIQNRVKSEAWLSHRSKKSWPGQLELKDNNRNTIVMNRHHNDNWFFVAMSGAVTGDITDSAQKAYDKMGSDVTSSKQINGYFKKYKGSTPIAPQIEIFNQIGNKKVDYVTMTLGGNDVDFVGVVISAAINVPYLEFASVKPTLMKDQPISKAVLASKLNYMVNNVLPDTLTRLEEKYNIIAQSAGSQAHIIIAGYPTIISVDSNNPIYTKADAEMIAEKVTYFNNQIYETVKKCERNGVNISFVSVDGDDQFGNHGAYSPNGEYVNGLTLTDWYGSQEISDGPLSGASFHPNEAGAKVYADCVQNEIDRIETQKTRVWGTVTDKENNPIPNVAVTLTDDKNKIKITNVSDSKGNYGIELDYEEGRHYTIKFEANHYETLVIKEKKGGNRITIHAKLENKRIYGTIIGKVLIEDNKSIENAKIEVYTFSDDKAIRFDEDEYYTNSKGEFSIDMPKGSYLLLITCDGYDPVNVKDITVEQNKTTHVNNIYLKKKNTEMSIPSDALIYNGHSYYIFSDTADTWEKAKKYCESLGGYLSIINNSEENNMLFNYMIDSGYESAYFGYSDSESEGNWKWVNNDTNSYTNWASNEPNSENLNEDYAMFYYKYKDGKWNDGDFSESSGHTIKDTSAFICEWNVAYEQHSLTASKLVNKSVREIIDLMNGEFKLGYIQSVWYTPGQPYFYNESVFPGMAFCLESLYPFYNDSSEKCVNDNYNDIVSKLKNGEIDLCLISVTSPGVVDTQLKLKDNMKYNDLTTIYGSFECNVGGSLGYLSYKVPDTNIILTFNTPDTIKDKYNNGEYYDKVLNEYIPVKHSELMYYNPELRFVNVFPSSVPR